MSDLTAEAEQERATYDAVLEAAVRAFAWPEEPEDHEDGGDPDL